MTTATAQTPALEAAPADTTPAGATPASVNAFSTTALVLAIVGIVLGQGLISAGAIVFAFVARAKEPTGRLVANWGLGLGFVGVFGGFVLAVLGIAAFAPIWLAGALAGWF